MRFDFDTFKLKDLSKINKGKQLNKEDIVENGEYYVLNSGKEPSGYSNSWNTVENTITISEGGNSCGFVNFNEEKNFGVVGIVIIYQIYLKIWMITIYLAI